MSMRQSWEPEYPKWDIHESNSEEHSSVLARTYLGEFSIQVMLCAIPNFGLQPGDVESFNTESTEFRFGPHPFCQTLPITDSEAAEIAQVLKEPVSRDQRERTGQMKQLFFGDMYFILDVEITGEGDRTDAIRVVNEFLDQQYESIAPELPR